MDPRTTEPGARRTAGTGKSHTLIGLGHAAVHAGLQGPLLHRRRPRRDPLPRPGRQHRRQDHRHPAARRPLILDELGLRPAGRHRHPTAVPPRRRRLRTPLAGHRLALAIRAMGPVPARAHHRRQHPRPAPAPRHRRHHRRPVLPHEDTQNRKEGTPTKHPEPPQGVGTFTWPPAGTSTWPLTADRLKPDSMPQAKLCASSIVRSMRRSLSQSNRYVRGLSTPLSNWLTGSSPRSTSSTAVLCGAPIGH